MWCPVFLGVPTGLSVFCWNIIQFLRTYGGDINIQMRKVYLTYGERKTAISGLGMAYKTEGKDSSRGALAISSNSSRTISIYRHSLGGSTHQYILYFSEDSTSLQSYQ